MNRLLVITVFSPIMYISGMNSGSSTPSSGSGKGFDIQAKWIAQQYEEDSSSSSTPSVGSQIARLPRNENAGFSPEVLAQMSIDSNARFQINQEKEQTLRYGIADAGLHVQRWGALTALSTLFTLCAWKCNWFSANGVWSGALVAGHIGLYTMNWHHKKIALKEELRTLEPE